jgi:hypothetical protein
VEETVLSETSDDSSQQSTERGNMEPPPTASTTHKCKKSEKKSAEDQFPQIETATLKLFAENSNMKADSDYQFLVSLLPFLKRVPISERWQLDINCNKCSSMKMK